jgi:hypothetical protein
VNTNTESAEPEWKPNPNINRNKPVVIGFLTYANGPEVIIFGGGLKGTGVPFTFLKYRLDHITRNNPITKSGIETKYLE